MRLEPKQLFIEGNGSQNPNDRIHPISNRFQQLLASSLFFFLHFFKTDLLNNLTFWSHSQTQSQLQNLIHSVSLSHIGSVIISQSTHNHINNVFYCLSYKSFISQLQCLQAKVHLALLALFFKLTHSFLLIVLNLNHDLQ